MSADWFPGWAKYHASLFALRDEADIQAMLQWELVFRAYHEPEMRAATLWLAKNPETFQHVPMIGGKMAGHLAAIQRALRAVLSISAAKEKESFATRFGTCDLCGSSGRVRVPNPRSVVSGRWLPLRIARGGPMYYTCAITCTCALGRWIAERSTIKQLTFEEYVRVNPNWKKQLDARAAELREEAKLAPPDPVWDDCVRRLVERVVSNHP